MFLFISNPRCAGNSTPREGPRQGGPCHRSNPQRGFFLPDSFSEDEDIRKAKDECCYPAAEKGRIDENLQHNDGIIWVLEKEVGARANKFGPGDRDYLSVPGSPEAEDTPITPGLT